MAGWKDNHGDPAVMSIVILSHRSTSGERVSDDYPSKCHADCAVAGEIISKHSYATPGRSEREDYHCII